MKDRKRTKSEQYEKLAANPQLAHRFARRCGIDHGGTPDELAAHFARTAETVERLQRQLAERKVKTSSKGSHLV